MVPFGEATGTLIVPELTAVAKRAVTSSCANDPCSDGREWANSVCESSLIATLPMLHCGLREESSCTDVSGVPEDDLHKDRNEQMIKPPNDHARRSPLFHSRRIPS